MPKHKALPDAYEVERILDVRAGKAGKEYLVKWSGYDSRNNSWEPAAHILDKGLIQSFQTSHVTEVEAAPSSSRSRELVKKWRKSTVPRRQTTIMSMITSSFQLQSL